MMPIDWVHILLAIGGRAAVTLMKRELDKRFEQTSAEQEARVIAVDLFGPRKSVRAVSLGGAFDGPGNVHPDHLYAAEALARPLNYVQDPIRRVARTLELPTSGDILVLGGPVSTKLSRALFEYDGPTSTTIARSKKPILPLRWHGIGDLNDPALKDAPRLAIATEGSGLRAMHNWPLYDKKTNSLTFVKPGKEVRLPTGKAFLPEDNYLTVTRMPNAADPSIPESAKHGRPISELPSVVVFDGRNSVGTRSAALLVQSADGRDALRRAAERIGYSSAFQVLFRVSRRVSRNGIDEFEHIAYVDAEPLEPTWDQVTELHERVIRSLTGPPNNGLQRTRFARR